MRLHVDVLLMLQPVCRSLCACFRCCIHVSVVQLGAAVTMLQSCSHLFFLVWGLCCHQGHCLEQKFVLQYTCKALEVYMDRECAPAVAMRFAVQKILHGHQLGGASNGVKKHQVWKRRPTIVGPGRPTVEHTGNGAGRARIYEGIGLPAT